MSKIELMPCGNCGGEAEFKFVDVYDRRDCKGHPIGVEMLFTIQCKECGVRHLGNFVINLHVEEGKESIEKELEMFDKAAEVWNKEQGRIDWNKVEIDTPIYVRDEDDEQWYKRHFAKFANSKVYAWIDGNTSFSTTQTTPWDYVRLAKKEEVEDGFHIQSCKSR